MLKIAIVFMFCIFVVSSRNLTADDEDFTTGGLLDDFLTQLEMQSGLGSLEPSHKVENIKCVGYTECTINPNGTLLWDVRSLLYRTHMMQSAEEESAQRTTLDGCLKYNPTDETSYNSCMNAVRFNMRIFLIMSFDNNFRSLVEADCGLAKENCVISTVYSV